MSANKKLLKYACQAYKKLLKIYTDQAYKKLGYVYMVGI